MKISLLESFPPKLLIEDDKASFCINKTTVVITDTPEEAISIDAKITGLGQLYRILVPEYPDQYTNWVGADYKVIKNSPGYPGNPTWKDSPSRLRMTPKQNEGQFQFDSHMYISIGAIGGMGRMSISADLTLSPVETITILQFLDPRLKS